MASCLPCSPCSLAARRTTVALLAALCGLSVILLPAAGASAAEPAKGWLDGLSSGLGDFQRAIATAGEQTGSAVDGPGGSQTGPVDPNPEGTAENASLAEEFAATARLEAEAALAAHREGDDDGARDAERTARTDAANAQKYADRVLDNQFADPSLHQRAAAARTIADDSVRSLRNQDAQGASENAELAERYANDARQTADKARALREGNDPTGAAFWEQRSRDHVGKANEHAQQVLDNDNAATSDRDRAVAATTTAEGAVASLPRFDAQEGREDAGRAQQFADIAERELAMAQQAEQDADQALADLWGTAARHDAITAKRYADRVKHNPNAEGPDKARATVANDTAEAVEWLSNTGQPVTNLHLDLAEQFAKQSREEAEKALAARRAGNPASAASWEQQARDHAARADGHAQNVLDNQPDDQEAQQRAAAAQTTANEAVHSLGPPESPAPAADPPTEGDTPAGQGGADDAGAVKPEALLGLDGLDDERGKDAEPEKPGDGQQAGGAIAAQPRPAIAGTEAVSPAPAHEDDQGEKPVDGAAMMAAPAKGAGSSEGDGCGPGPVLAMCPGKHGEDSGQEGITAPPADDQPEGIPVGDQGPEIRVTTPPAVEPGAGANIFVPPTDPDGGCRRTDCGSATDLLGAGAGGVAASTDQGLDDLMQPSSQPLPSPLLPSPLVVPVGGAGLVMPGASLSWTQPWTQEQATDGQLVSGPVTDPFTGLDAPLGAPVDAPPGTGLVTSPGGAAPVGADPAATESGMRCGYYC